MHRQQAMMVVLTLMLVSGSYGLVSNVTEYDDGSSRFNMTANTSKQVSMPINSTILVANLTIKGILSSDINAIAVTNVTSYSYGANWTGPGNVVDDNHTSTASVTRCTPVAGKSCTTYDSIYLNYTYSNYIPLNSKYEVSTYNTQQGYTRRNVTLPAACTYSNNTQIKVIGCSSDCGIQTVCANGCTVSDSVEYLCYNNVSYQSFFTAGTCGCIDVESENSSYIAEDSMYVSVYPRDVILRVNDTVFFNHTGNLTGENKTSFITELESCNEYEAICPFIFSSAYFGKIELSGLMLQFNKTYLAQLDIQSPAEIQATISQGQDYSVDITLNNSGNYAATDLDIYTVSAEYSPNLDDTITHNCQDMESGSTQLCTITFNTPSFSAEPDERLRISATGTDAGDLVYSDFIDVDIVVSGSITPSGGGGGGGIVVIDKTNKSVVIDFGVLYYEQLLFYAPREIEDKLLIKNRGNKEFIGNVKMDGELGKYLTAKVCDVTLDSCDANGIVISPGESKILVIFGDIEEFDAQSAEGIVQLKSYQTTDGSFELKAVLNRPPAWSAQKVLIDKYHFSEQAALYSLYAGFFGTVILIGYIAKVGVGL